MAQQRKDRPKRKLTITSYETKATFTNKKGEDATIYAVSAVNESGEPVDLELRSFWEPGSDELNKLVEYEVERYEHEKYGVSYTLHKPGGRGGGLKASVDKLRTQLKDAEEEIAVLKDRVGGLENRMNGVGGAAPAAAPAGQQPPSNQAKRQSPGGADTGRFGSDDDIPF